MIEKVRSAMHRENADTRRLTGIGPVQRSLADTLKRDELRIRQCSRRAESDAEDDGESECGALHAVPLLSVSGSRNAGEQCPTLVNAEENRITKSLSGRSSGGPRGT